MQSADWHLQVGMRTAMQCNLQITQIPRLHGTNTLQSKALLERCREDYQDLSPTESCPQKLHM